MPPVQTLEDFRSSAAGTTVARFLGEPETLARMEALSRAGRPAVLALDERLPDGFGLGDGEKQHAGRMIRDRMYERGWRIGPRRQFRTGRVFSSGAVYERASQRDAAVKPVAPPRTDDFKARLLKAQKIVRHGSTNDYSVDDFLRDRHAEASRELEA